MPDQPEVDHCYTPSWCKCPDEPKCRLCKQGRCPLEAESDARRYGCARCFRDVRAACCCPEWCGDDDCGASLIGGPDDD